MYALVHFAVAIVAYQLLIARRMVRLLFVINILKINPMLVEPGAYSLPDFFFFAETSLPLWHLSQ